MIPALTCTKAWMNLGTGNVQLEMNRLITLQDRSELRTNLIALLENQGINFRTHTKDHRLLMEPTLHGQDPEEMKTWIGGILEKLGFGENIKIKDKFVSSDLLGAGPKSKVTILPSDYFSQP